MARNDIVNTDGSLNIKRLGEYHDEIADTNIQLAQTTSKVYNINGYGADPTGVDDSTTIVQQVINDAFTNGGGVIRFSKGVYKITSSLIIPESVAENNLIILEGDGTWNTELNFAISSTEKTAGILADGTKDSRRYFAIKDLSLRGDKSPNVSGIYANYNVPDTRFENIQVKDFADDGIRLGEGWNITLLNVRSINNDNNGVTVGKDLNDNNKPCNNVRFVGGEYLQNGNTQMYIKGISHGVFGSDVSGGLVGIHAYFAYGLGIYAPYTELCKDYNIYIDSCKSVHVSALHVELAETSQLGNVYVLNSYGVGIDGMNVENADPLTTKCITLNGARGFSINNCLFAKGLTGVDITNSRGKIENVEFGLELTNHLVTANSSSVHIKTYNLRNIDYTKCSLGANAIHWIETTDGGLGIPRLAVAPANPQSGMLAMSNGANGGFDGVSGAGLYRWQTGTSEWIFIG